MSDNLPVQAHGADVARPTVLPENPYQIDQTMVKLPSLYLAQFASKAFKARLVNFGDIYVALGADDPEPQVCGGVADGQALSSAVRFYVHSVAPGYQVADKDAPYGKRSLRLGTPFAQALQEAGGDPRNVFQQTHMTLTIPDYPLYPVRFIMGSRWGGSSARWINSKISMGLQEGKRPLDMAFSLQTRPTSNDSGDFVDAVVGFADVPAKQAKDDQKIVSDHAELLSSGNVQVDFDVDDVKADTSEAPALG
jgi:hypothetical protein